MSIFRRFHIGREFVVAALVIALFTQILAIGASSQAMAEGDGSGWSLCLPGDGSDSGPAGNPAKTSHGPECCTLCGPCARVILADPEATARPVEPVERVLAKVIWPQTHVAAPAGTRPPPTYPRGPPALI